MCTNVCALNGGLWGLESQTNILIPSPSSLSDSALSRADLAGEEDMGLLLESTLRLHSQLGGHFLGGSCGVSLAGVCESSFGGALSRWAAAGEIGDMFKIVQ